MKKLSFLLLPIYMIFLQSCNNFVDIRVRTLKDGSILRIVTRKSISKYYSVGDTILIYGINEKNWKIKNTVRMKDTTIFHSGFYYPSYGKNDSLYEPAYSSTYINVVIEKIN